MMMAAQQLPSGSVLICHSDRGSQYATDAYVNILSPSTPRPRSAASAIATTMPYGEFLLPYEGRAGPSMPMGVPVESLTGAIQIHRRLLQPASDALGPQVSHSRASRAAHDLLIQRVRRPGKIINRLLYIVYIAALITPICYILFFELSISSETKVAFSLQYIAKNRRFLYRVVR
jgi:hypothetical protein